MSSSSLTIPKNFWLHLSSKDRNVQKQEAIVLREWMEEQKRQISVELFDKLNNELTTKVFNMVSSNNMHERIGGILVMQQLIDIQQSEENETKTIRFHSYLRMVIDQSTNGSQEETLRLATQVLGHLAKVAMNAELIEREVSLALSDLQQTKSSDYKKLSCVWIISELAKCVPTLFHIHLNRAIDIIWNVAGPNRAAVRLTVGLFPQAFGFDHLGDARGDLTGQPHGVMLR